MFSDTTVSFGIIFCFVLNSFPVLLRTMEKSLCVKLQHLILFVVANFNYSENVTLIKMIKQTQTR